MIVQPNPSDCYFGASFSSINLTRFSIIVCSMTGSSVGGSCLGSLGRSKSSVS